MCAEYREPPSARKRARARRRGDVSYSLDLTRAAARLGAVVSVLWGGPRAVDALRAYIGHVVSDAPRAVSLSVEALVHGAQIGASILGPALGLVAAVGVVVATVQVGRVLSLDPVSPAPERLWPDVGRLWRRESLGDVGVAAARALVLLALGLALAVWAAPALLTVPRETSALRLEPLLWASAALAVATVGFGLVDLVRRRRAHARALRMTRAERQREAREEAGDPAVRARLRRSRAEP